MLGGVNILKPVGWSSSDVVVKVRGILRSYVGDKKVKVGHMGTLDPGGSGVLPILFGKATRLFDYRLGGRKLYRAFFVFGKSTDTLDSYGKLTHSGARIPSIEEIQSVLSGFIGEIDQVPPEYSSVSVGGLRGYAAARKGIVLDMPLRKVNIYSISIRSFENSTLEVDVECSGGTYIRSLGRDIAKALDSVMYMSAIIRLADKNFSIEDSITIEEFSTAPEKGIITIDELLRDEIRVDIDAVTGVKLLNGLSCPANGIDGVYALYIDSKCYGLCKDNHSEIETVVRLWE